MFGFIQAAWRKLEAALYREAKAADRTAELREKYNEHVIEQLQGMGVELEPKALTVEPEDIILDEVKVEEVKKTSKGKKTKK